MKLRGWSVVAVVESVVVEERLVLMGKMMSELVLLQEKRSGDQGDLQWEAMPGCPMLWYGGKLMQAAVAGGGDARWLKPMSLCLVRMLQMLLGEERSVQPQEFGLNWL